MAKICDRGFWSIEQQVVKNCHFLKEWRSMRWASAFLYLNICRWSPNRIQWFYLAKEAMIRFQNCGRRWNWRGRFPVLRELFRRVGTAWLPWPWPELCTRSVKIHEAQQSKLWNLHPLLCLTGAMLSVILSEISQSQRDRYCIIPLTCDS